jgi:hypothetical protein
MSSYWLFFFDCQDVRWIFFDDVDLEKKKLSICFRCLCIEEKKPQQIRLWKSFGWHHTCWIWKYNKICNLWHLIWSLYFVLLFVAFYFVFRSITCLRIDSRIRHIYDVWTFYLTSQLIFTRENFDFTWFYQGRGTCIFIFHFDLNYFIFFSFFLIACYGHVAQ